MQVEILGPDGKVHYRREHNDKDVAEALRACEYSVFVPMMGMTALSILPTVSGESHEIEVSNDGTRVWSCNREPRFVPNARQE